MAKYRKSILKSKYHADDIVIFKTKEFKRVAKIISVTGQEYEFVIMECTDNPEFVGKRSSNPIDKIDREPQVRLYTEYICWQKLRKLYDTDRSEA